MSSTLARVVCLRYNAHRQTLTLCNTDSRKAPFLQRESPNNAKASGAKPPCGFSLGGHWLPASPPPPGLHVVATPIGNLGDITVRALQTLAGADRILCEDTRMTRRLLDRYAIVATTEAFHEHNAESRLPGILQRLETGAAIALVSDAGTPLISDPGFRLVDAARVAGLPVHAVPGPSALTAALSIAGLATDAAHFVGFLPPKQGARRTAIKALADQDATLVLYEGPHRLLACLRDLLTVLGDRTAAVARELTKRHEEVIRGPLSEVIASFEDRDAIKGEIVILVDRADAARAEDIDLDSILREALEAASLRDAVAQVTEATGMKRAIIYERALHLSGRKT